MSIGGSGCSRMENGRSLMLLAEIAVFSAIAPNFFTRGNFFEVIRSSVELGLLALAMTPVIITGGIDLSVGSMMGLAAVIFGAAFRDWHFSIASAAGAALLAGFAGGALNALAISRLNLPPLIVTLGTFSMFRGIAEGITHGAVNYYRLSKIVLVSRPRIFVGRDSRTVDDFSRRF